MPTKDQELRLSGQGSRKTAPSQPVTNGGYGTLGNPGSGDPNSDYFPIQRTDEPLADQERRQRDEYFQSFQSVPIIGSYIPPDPAYYGGGSEQLQGLREKYHQGQVAGQNIMEHGLSTTNQGLGMMGQTYGTAGQNVGLGYDMYDQGQGIGYGGMGAQDAALTGMMGTASMPVASVAEQQQRMASNAQAGQLMAAAAATRGGNQAAALRNAGAQVSANSLVQNQQLAQMRLQEEQARRSAMMDAQQAQANAYGQRAEMGFGQQTQGLGAANTATAQMGALGGAAAETGLGMGKLGQGTTGQYLDAEHNANAAQFGVDAKQEDAQRQRNADAMGDTIGMIGKAFSFGF